MAYTKQVKAAAILNNGFSVPNAPVGGDGVSLFNTSHPLVNGGTNSNTFSTAPDLNETSLEAAVIQIAAWTDERGLLIAGKPRKLVVPPNQMLVSKRLLIRAHGPTRRATINTTLRQWYMPSFTGSPLPTRLPGCMTMPEWPELASGAPSSNWMDAG